MNEDLELFDPFRYFYPAIKSIILKEEEPMLRTYNYLYNHESQNYRIIFRDDCDREGIWYVDSGIPAFSVDDEDRIATVVDALNAAEVKKHL